MEPKNYRIIIKFDAETQKFIAEVPELDDCTVTGETREEVANLIDNTISEKLSTLEYAPKPIDEVEFDGNLTVEISKTLYRDLLFLTRTEGVEPGVIVSEILSDGIGRRCGYHRSNRNRQNNRRDQNQRKNNISREQYNNIMEDKAHFLEYVRNLEQSPKSGKGRRQRAPQDE